MCDEKIITWDISVHIIAEPSQFPVDRRCNNLTFVNLSPSAGNVALVNQIPIAQNTSFQMGGNRNEIFTGNINIAFNGVGVNSLYVIQKFYNDKCLQ